MRRSLGLLFCRGANRRQPENHKSANLETKALRTADAIMRLVSDQANNLEDRLAVLNESQPDSAEGA